MLETQKPIKRGKIRRILGHLYYSTKRYGIWLRKSYAKERMGADIGIEIFRHETLLLRKLKDVDMRLQHNKITNLKIASAKIDGLVLRPGETFSYWRLIGKAQKSKGYLPGMVLSSGKVTEGIGGGLCQLSNLIYWLTLHTPLTVTERHRHSYDVFPDSHRTQPFGSGATCAYNYLDLQIRNQTQHTYQLRIFLTQTHLVGTWRQDGEKIYTYQVYEKKHWISHEFWGGYLRHNELWRKVYDLDNHLISDEWVTENHALMMYSPMLEQKGDEILSDWDKPLISLAPKQ